MTATMSWVTNNWAPYRRPVWDHIGTKVRLTVHLLVATPHDVARMNRGQDWVAPEENTTTYVVRTPRLARIRLPRYELSLLLAPWSVCSAETIVLGGWEDLVYWQLLLLARVRRRRVIGFYESTSLTNRHKHGLIAAARRFYFRRLDAVVTAGTASSQAVRAFGVEQHRILTGFNAVDVEAAHAAAQQARSMPHAQRVSSGKLIYVGQLIARKNVDSLLAAVAALDENYTLTVVGMGEEEDSLRAVAAKLGVTHKVTFLGYRSGDTIAAMMAEHATLILPSLEEVWGLVVNEALACGLHVVVSDVSGVAESVKDMRGVYVSGTSAADLAEQIERSSRDWEGPIADPEILVHTPAVFAENFLRASGSARSSAGNVRDYSR